MAIDPKENNHYIIQVTNLPPTELVCHCGALFQGPDCLEQMTTHTRFWNERAFPR
jgi:hypothetical protein